MVKAVLICKDCIHGHSAKLLLKIAANQHSSLATPTLAGLKAENESAPIIALFDTLLFPFCSFSVGRIMVRAEQRI